MPTLLHALTRQNVEVNDAAVVPGSNTTVDGRVLADTWVPWTDFNYATLTRIFCRELNSPYGSSADQRPLHYDMTINNEETLEDILRRFISPVVNYALEGQTGRPHLGRGSRCRADFRPDWSVISASRVDEWGQPRNILPGDNKLHVKWWSNMVQDDESNLTEWRKVVTQILTYMAWHQSRYGFILTNAYLVAFRLTRESTGPGIGITRSRRETAPLAADSMRHQRHSSDATMTSGGGSRSSYSDNDPFAWDYCIPEVAAVPWEAHGESRLTVKLALWCLSMMATNGDSFIDYSYPGLDSWRRTRRGFIHNTSGATKARLSEGESLQEIDPDRRRRESDARKAAHRTLQNPQEDKDEYAPQFSQAGSTLGSFAGQSYTEGDEASVQDNSSEQAQGPAAGPSHHRSPQLGEQAETGTSHRPSKRDERKHVTIKRHRISTGLYFVNANGYKVDTSRRKWKKVEGGYEFSGSKHLYFTKEFPK